MDRVVISKSEADTEMLAGELAESLGPGSVVALHGELGAGKTVFARGFARALGIDEPITSPTFTIIQEYPSRRGRFNHLDLYRIDNSEAALVFGVDEYLYDPESISLVEWPERIGDILPPSTVHVHIEPFESPDGRRITLPESG